MAENLKSSPITNLDATPQVMLTTGEGAVGSKKSAFDQLAPTASAAQYSTYRLTRFPTNAKIRQVREFISGVDTSTVATATYDFNVAFSDNTSPNFDGTPFALQGTIPSSNWDGTSLAYRTASGYATTYASAGTVAGTGNKLFGNVAGANSGTAPTKYTDITFNGATFKPTNCQDDLWNVLGFTNSQGTGQDPGGFFDIFVVIAAAVAGAAVGVICTEVDYVL